MSANARQMIIQFLTTGGLFGLCSWLWCSADFWRKYLVKRYLLSVKRDPSYDFPKFDPHNVDQILGIILRGRDPLLIDGPSGAGKTTAVRHWANVISQMQEVFNESAVEGTVPYVKKRYGSAYLCLRTVSPDEMTVSLAKQFGYIGKGANHDNVDQALDCLRDAIYELSRKAGIQTEVFIDDIERSFSYCKPPTKLGKTLVAELALRVSDLKAGRVIFVTSDNFVFGEMRKISGVEKRLEYFPFPTISEKTYLDYIGQNRDFFEPLVKDSEIAFKEFYRIFGPNMRSIENWLKSGKSMQTFIKMRLGGEKNGLRVSMKDLECYNIMRRISIGETVFEDDVNAGPCTSDLVSQRLLRLSWNINLERTVFQPATPLIHASLQDLLKEGYFKESRVIQKI